jgi:SAM-dependent methyltransferase
MRDRWAADFDARARAFWTQDRTRGLLGSKTLILPPVDYGPLLRAMGLLKADASMSPEAVRKYMQVSHMLTLLEPQLRDLAQAFPVVRVLDLACGNSYLTLTIATSLKHRIRCPAQVLGVDRNERLISACRQRAQRLSLDDFLRFEPSVLDALNLQQAWQRAFGTPSEIPPVHLLIALHACDTATDDALALAIAMRVPALAVVPCCQAQLAQGWSELAARGTAGALAPIWQWPHLRREAAATMTDALRVLLLRGCGYEAAPIEFVPSSHTPKNTMLRANRAAEGSPANFSDYVALREALGGVRIRLELLLPEPHRSQLHGAER